MSYRYLEFEKPVSDIEKRIEELRDFSQDEESVRTQEIKKLEKKAEKLLKDIYSSLSPWQTTLSARHPMRPYTLDYIEHICDEFVELHGDRLYKDDPAIVGGLGRIDGRPVVIIGHQKGRNIKERIHRNYGMPHPEGYRKALRLMELSERFKRPLVTFVDTPGAAPDVEAEERGQSEAIARNLLFMSRLKTPIVTVIIGEGGSGGALAIAMGDRVLMLEYSTYSVISPEGCAAILWKDGTQAELAAKALKMSAGELLRLGVIDGIIREPIGGAQRDYKSASENVKKALSTALDQLSRIRMEKLISLRYEKFRGMGIVKQSR